MGFGDVLMRARGGLLVVPLIAAALAGPARAAEPLRAGIIGCDTSHVVAFTQLINAPDAKGYLAQVEVVAAFPGGSEDIPDSKNRLAGFVEKLRGMNVEIVDSIDDLLSKVDVVLLESVDGRPHLAQARPVIAAGKPVFIDKPMAGNLAEAVEIARLAAANKDRPVPWFSSSALRYGSPATVLAANTKIGEITGCDVYAPCAIESHHPELFWYGIHGVECMYTLLGPGCREVTRVKTGDGDVVVVGTWQDGRVGIFRGQRHGHDYGATAYGTKGIASAIRADAYDSLVVEICKFFVTGKPPVAPEVTLEIYAFMQAADESKRHDGAPVQLDAVMEAARSAAPGANAMPHAVAGYFDLQVNGYAGVDFNDDGLSVDDLHRACAAMRADGVGQALATVITADLDAMARRIARIAAACSADSLVADLVAGIHVEGPLISSEAGYVGAHPAAHARPASLEVTKRLVDAGGGLVRMVTLAPERDADGAVTRWLVAQARVSAGHCNPSLDQLQRAIDAGLSMFTHLGNGCPLVMHRHDNVIQRVLSLADRLWVSFIADGVHIPFPVLRNFLKIVGPERAIVVSDAVAAAGMGPGLYQLAGQQVVVDEQLATWSADRSHLVGSACTLKQMAVNLRDEVGLSPEVIDKLTARNPRAALGI